MAEPPSSPSPAQLLWRLSGALATDLSDGADLLELTYTLVLRNLLKKIKKCGSKAYPLLKIIVPYVVLLAGGYETFQQVGTIRSMLTAVSLFVTAPFSSKMTVPANHHLNADILSWLAARGLARDARTLALVARGGAANITYDYDQDNEDSVTDADTGNTNHQPSHAAQLHT